MEYYWYLTAHSSEINGYYIPLTIENLGLKVLHSFKIL